MEGNYENQMDSCVISRDEKTARGRVAELYECKTIASWLCGVSPTRIPTCNTKSLSKGVCRQPKRQVRTSGQAGARTGTRSIGQPIHTESPVHHDHDLPTLPVSTPLGLICGGSGLAFCKTGLHHERYLSQLFSLFVRQPL